MESIIRLLMIFWGAAKLSSTVYGRPTLDLSHFAGGGGYGGSESTLIVDNLSEFGYSQGSDARTFDVVDYGAVGDRQTDDSKAFMKAWGGVCAAKLGSGIVTLKIPNGKTFLLQPVKFEGPCQTSCVHVQILGNIIAPKRAGDWKFGGSLSSWLEFSKVDNLIIDGSGTIDGQGSSWWAKAAEDRPTALRFSNCDGVRLSGLTHINSPRNHISISDCNTVSLSHLRMYAPGESPNTDGIDITESTQVQIFDSIIATGDDCVAINGGCSYINITNVACGPGHGISVGSLGKNGQYETVEEVHVYSCIFNGTDNGARIKTWQGGSGFVRNISFKQIKLNAAKNPIIIDQYYCNGKHNCKDNGKSLAINNVSYVGFQGTTASKQAITFECSDPGCGNIVMENVHITSSTPGKETRAYCQNVHGVSGYPGILPPVQCGAKSIASYSD